ncbi:MAG: hypothetical protein ACYTDX_07515, partial [Planctomycetota bacterium]
MLPEAYRVGEARHDLAVRRAGQRHGPVACHGVAVQANFLGQRMGRDAGTTSGVDEHRQDPVGHHHRHVRCSRAQVVENGPLVHGGQGAAGDADATVRVIDHQQQV